MGVGLESTIVVQIYSAGCLRQLIEHGGLKVTNLWNFCPDVLSSGLNPHSLYSLYCLYTRNSLCPQTSQLLLLSWTSLHRLSFVAAGSAERFSVRCFSSATFPFYLIRWFRGLFLFPSKSLVVQSRLSLRWFSLFNFEPVWSSRLSFFSLYLLAQKNSTLLASVVFEAWEFLRGLPHSLAVSLSLICFLSLIFSFSL